MSNFFRPGEIPSIDRGKSNRHNTMTSPTPVAQIERCKMCSFRIRGPNHDEGAHHRKVSLKK